MLYRTTCVITGRFYIGCHSTANLSDGYLGSGKFLKNSIQKYGIDKHQREILELYPDRSSLMLREQQVVNEELLADKLCMNLKRGGDGGLTGLSKKTIKKISAAGHAGMKLKMQDPVWRDAYIKKLSLAQQKLSDDGKPGWAGNKPGRNIGSRRSDETKLKMSLAGTGSDNSQAGTCWIFKDDVNKKIKNSELHHYLDAGWFKGRRCQTKLSDEQILAVRRERANGTTIRKLAEQFGVSASNIVIILSK